MSCKTTPRDADVSSQDSGCWSFLENSRHHKTGDKNYGSGSGMARSSPCPVPTLFAPLAGTAQGTGESPEPCDICATLQRLERPLAREAGTLCWKNPLCLLPLAFPTEGHLSGLEFCLGESGREP